MNYIWDFDGTLYDTYPIMLKALMQTFEDFSIKKTDKVIYRKIKEESIHQMIIDWQLPNPAFGQCYHAYEAEKINNAFPFKESKETLERLVEQGGQHFILTHRTVASTWSLLKRDGLDGLIVDIIGSDSNYPRKPDPAAINHLTETYKLDSARTVMIGDRKLDVEAGKNAGVQTVFFDMDQFQQSLQATYRINNLKEMVQIFSGDRYN